MPVGALAMAILDAGHSRIAGATASLFRTLPMVERFQRSCEAEGIRSSRELRRLLPQDDDPADEGGRAFPLHRDASVLNQMGLVVGATASLLREWTPWPEQMRPPLSLGAGAT
eukprot:4519232-Alexandrium_andersonii.AAC.1